MAFSNVTFSRVSSNTANVIVAYESFTNANGNTSSISIAVDYSNVFSTIAAAAQNISSSLNTLNTYVLDIKQSITNIENYIQNIDQRASTESLGIITREYNDPDSLSPKQQRAITVSALKNSGSLDSVTSEINNPTQLPTGG